MKKYVVLECVFDDEEVRHWAEKEYHLVFGCLDALEDGLIYHNSYYIIIGSEENIKRWLKDCYCQFEDELNEIMEDLKDLEV